MSTKVVLNESEPIESALKKFRRKVQLDQILKDVKSKTFFMTRRARLAKKKIRKSNRDKS